MLKDCSKQQTVSWLLYEIFLNIYIILCQLLCNLKYHCVIIVLCTLTNLYSTNSISLITLKIYGTTSTPLNKTARNDGSCVLI